MLKISCCVKLLIAISSFILPSFERNTAYNLKAVSVVFRHGDRTPENLYPNDPHNTKEFYPVPLGGLINSGKNREYELGKFLRSTYNEFLGDLYVPSQVYARSTDMERTQMSLLLVLAGLFPPQGVQRWRNDLNWQPIPITSAPLEDDPLLHPVPCPTWRAEMEKVKKSKAYRKEAARFNDLMKIMTKYTGSRVSCVNEVMKIFHTLTSERAMNMALPKWTEAFFPKGLILEAALFQYKATNYNNFLKKVNGGTVLRKIIDDYKALKRGKPSPKIFLYSAHEMTVAALLFALNVWKPQAPEYSSAVILELWEKKTKNYVKILYYRGIPPVYEIRTVPGCTDYCRFKEFRRLLHDVLPDDYVKECRGYFG